MSLILEALRKSEAERRRGETPELHVELAPLAQRRQREAPGWVWPMTALALGAVALLAWSWRAPEPDPVAEAAAPVAMAPPPAVAASPVENPTERAPSPSATAPLAAPAPPQIQPRQTPRVAATERPQLPPAAPVQPPTTAPPPAPREAAAVRATGERIASSPVAEVAKPAASVPAVAPAPAPLAAAPGAGSGEPTTLADLSAEERRQLPPLKISMHFWAPTPTERFAIVDGSRVGEGDRIGNAVVDAITADAVVLGWNGRRVHLPIR